jgi:DNA-binding response OmpR family regulator
MDTSQEYILLLGQRLEGTQVISFLVNQSWPVFVAQSDDQAIARVQEATPCLVILAGNQQHWPQALVKRLRDQAEPKGTIILALTDSDEPRWSLDQEDTDLDGFLVQPVSYEVLTSLIESALAKTTL